ncbi:hypothetical protein B0H21DRAFT_823948 [Amylocystis lapponica]|nr:hypothetical protein B0H21DRAFT_823948 [Amylocystis lapponica]
MISISIYSSYIKPRDLFRIKTNDVDPEVEDIIDLIRAKWLSTFNKRNVDRSELELMYSVCPKILARIFSGVRLNVNVVASSEHSRDEHISQLHTCDRDSRQFQFVLRIKERGPAENAHSAAVKNALDAPSPHSVAGSITTFISEQNEHPIYNGRPEDRCSSPVVLYAEAFAMLKDTLRDLPTGEPDWDLVAATAKLFTSAVELCESEDDRHMAIIERIGTVLSIRIEDVKHGQLARTGHTKAIADTLASVPLEDEQYGKKEGIYVYLDIKNELGMDGDGGLQGALTLRKFIAQDKYKEIRNVSCCPCIVVSVAGPYICIAGAVLVDVFIVQPFTDYIYLGGDPFRMDRIMRVAKIFGAVSKAVMSLREYYQHLSLGSTPALNRLFPTPSYIDDRPDGELVFTARFDYKGRREDNYSRSLFRATYNGAPVLVKFCESVALLCTGRGHLLMVIMDFVDGCNAHFEFPHEKVSGDVMDDVRRAVGALHDAGLVFGDLRRSNIMVVRNTDATSSSQEEKTAVRYRALLVDFDWAGVDGETRYTALLNDLGDIEWAHGVKPAGLMRKQHDLEMIAKLNSV